MALNIDVSVEQSNKNVDALGNKIVALADKAEEAGKRAGKALSFGTFAKDEIANIRKAMSDLNAIVKNFNDISSQAKRGMNSAQSDATKYLKQVQALSKALNDQNRALRDSQAALAAQTAKLNASTAATKANAAAQARLGAALNGIGIGKHTAGLNAGATGMAAFAAQSKIAAQSTAALRGAFQGAGAGMGIFTSNTIAAGAAAYGIAKALSATIAVGSEFEDTFNRAMALLGEMTRFGGTNQLSEQGALIKKEIIDIATTSKFSAQETADAVKELAQAGLNSGQVLAGLRPILNTATVGMLSVADAAKITTNIIEQFGMSFDEVAKVGDILAKGANISTIEVSDLARSLSYTGTIAHQTGISLQDTATAIALLGQAGIRGSKGGTAMRDIIADLAMAESGSGKAAKAIKALGVEIVKDPVTGGLKLKETFENLNKAMVNLSPAQRYAALLSIFGKIGATGAAALVNFSAATAGASSKWDQFSEKIYRSQGENQRLADIMNDNLATALKNLKGAFETVAVTAEATFGPGLTARIKTLIDYIRDNREQLASNLASIMNSLVTAVDFLVRNGPVIVSLLKAFLEFKALKFVFMEAALAIQFFTKAGGAMATIGQTVALNSMSTASALNMAAGGAAAAAKGAGAAATAFGVLGGAGSLLTRIIGGLPGLIALVGAGVYTVYSDLKQKADDGVAANEGLQRSFEEIDAIALQLAKDGNSGLESMLKSVAADSKTISDRLIELQKVKDQLAAQPPIVRVGKEYYDNSDNQTAGVKNLQDEIDRLNVKLNESNNLVMQMTNNLGTQAFRDPVMFEVMTRSIDALSLKVLGFLDTYNYVVGVLNATPLHIDTSGVQGFFDSFKAYVKSYKEAASMGPSVALAGPKPEDVAGIEAAKSRMSELANVLKEAIKGFGGLEGAAGEAVRQLAQLDAVEASLNSKKLAQTLQDLGVSAEYASKAIDFARGKVELTGLSKVLGEVDPRFKQLAAIQDDTTRATTSYAEATAQAAVYAAAIYKTEDERAAAMARWAPLIQSIADGTYAAQKRLEDFVKSSDAAFAGFTEVDTASAIVEKFRVSLHGLTTEQETAIRGAANQDQVMKVLGTDFFKTNDVMTQYSKAIESLNALHASGAIDGLKFAEAMAGIRKASPYGAIEEDIKKLNGEIDALQQGGTRAVEEFDAAWDATGGHIEKADAELLALIDKRQQLSEMKAAVQSLFQGLDTVLHNIFDGTYKNAKDLLSGLKDMFKNFLVDLIVMAIKNKIMLNFGVSGTSGSSSGGDIFSSLLSAFSGAANGSNSGGGIPYFGSNSTINGPQGGGGTAWMGTLMQGYQQLGMGQQAYNLFGALGTGGQAAQGAANFGNVAGGVSSTAPTVAPMYGGSIGGWSTMGLGGALYGASYGSTLGSGGVSTGIATGTGAIAGYGLGLGASAALGAAGTAGATAGGIASAGVGAVPVVGWIALAALLIDKFSGGKLFGTKWRPEQSTVSTKISDTGTDVAAYFLQSKQGSLFSGKKWKGESVDAGDDARKAAADFFDQLKTSVQDAATKLGKEAAPLVDAEIQQVIQYTNKGKVKATSYLVDIIGRTWTEATAEAASARVQAEQIINAIDYGDASSKASEIAERWRGNAETLLDGANMMVAAQADINSDRGLLGINSTLGDTVDIVEELKKSSETLVDAYARIYAATDLLREAVSLTGVDLGKTGVEFVQFASDIADAAGGIENATNLWNAFFAAFYTPAEASIYQFNQLKDSVTKNLKDIGLSADTSMGEFRTAFEKALPDLSPDAIVKWLKAGDALAQLFKLGDPAVTFMQGIHDSLAQLIGGSSTNYKAALDAIKTQMDANIATAKLLGLSQRDLNDIERLAVLQTKQLIMSLKKDIHGLVTQLNGFNFDELNNSQSNALSTQQQLADQSAAMSQAQLDAEKARYTAAQAAIKQIDEFLKSLQTGDLSSGDWLSRLNATQSQFQDTLAGAQAGNPDDIANLVSAAQTYLQQAQGAYGNSDAYDTILHTVTDALTAMQQTLGGFQNPPDQPTVGSNGGQNTNVISPVQVDPDSRNEIAHEIAAQIGALGLATGEDIFKLLDENHVSIQELADAFGINLQKLDADSLAGLGDLAYLLGVPITDLLSNLGVSAEAIAAAANLDLSTINDNLISQLVTLAAQLDTSTLGLIDFLGIPLTDLATFFGVKLDDLTSATVDGLVAMSTALGVSTLDVIAALGINIADLLGANGVDLSTLDANNFTNFVALATSLHVSLVDLWTALGKNITDLGTLLVASFTTGLSVLDDLPDDVMAGLQPFIDELDSATTPEEIAQATSDIRGFIEGLPEAQRAILAPIFDSVFGTNGLDGTITDAATQANTDAGTQIELLGGISSGTHNIDVQTVSINTGINSVKDKLDTVNENLRAISGGTQAIGDVQKNAADEQSSFYDDSFDWNDAVTEALQDIGARGASDAGAASEDYTQSSERQQRQNEEGNDAVYGQTNVMEDMHGTLTKTHEAIMVLTAVVATKMDKQTQSTQTGNTDLRKLRKTSRVGTVPTRLKK